MTARRRHRGFISATITNCATSAPIAGRACRWAAVCSVRPLADGTLTSNFGVAPGSYTATVTAPNYGTGHQRSPDGDEQQHHNFALCLNGQPVMAATALPVHHGRDAVPPNNAVDRVER